MTATDDQAVTAGRIRKIVALNMAGVIPAGDCAPVPEILWVDPRELVVDETYQRNLSERSITIIRRIVGAWDWRQYKAPTVVRGPHGLEVVDGQHTAIGAASHPGIAKIPVLVTTAESLAARASAFVGVNRNRVALRAEQIYHAAMAAGDEDALTVAQVTERAGIIILKSPPSYGRFKPRETLAIGSISALIKRRGAMRAREALQMLAEAELAPVRADHIKAAEVLLHAPEYGGGVQTRGHGAPDPRACRRTRNGSADFRRRAQSAAVARPRRRIFPERETCTSISGLSCSKWRTRA